jgi:peptidoglycan-associated lipoprotein
MRIWLGGVAIALLMVGCATREPDAASRPTIAAVPGPTHGDRVAAPPAAPIVAVPGPILEGVDLSKRSIYFDFDSNVVRDEYQPTIRNHSLFMIKDKRGGVRIEGNTDERGSREYNLALGQRRAEAVKKVMTVLGVPSNRIETISYGEEKPRNAGHDERSWAENRRADIRYPGE